MGEVVNMQEAEVGLWVKQCTRAELTFEELAKRLLRRGVKEKTIQEMVRAALLHRGGL